MTDVVRKPEPQSSPSPPPSPSVNFALVLSRMIDSVQQNPVELRAAVYELARVKLVEQFGHEDEAEIRRLAAALEEAIDGVENFSRHEDERKGPVALPAWSTGSRSNSRPPVEQTTDNSVYEALARSRLPSGSAHVARGAFGVAGRLGVLGSVIAAIGATIAFWPQLRDLKPFYAEKPAVAPAPVVALPPPPPPLGFPVPTTFGVYAITGGRLQELKPLAVRVPDLRVAISAAISTPGDISFPDGDLKFIIYRRDIVASAPDRIDVRVIAKVARQMGVDSAGKGRVTPAQEPAWVIRNIAIPYKVGPVDQHPEMILIQAETSAKDLPAGRYALALKDQGYDFTVAGSVTDSRQCMERVDALNGTFYAACK